LDSKQNKVFDSCSKYLAGYHSSIQSASLGSTIASLGPTYCLHGARLY